MRDEAALRVPLDQAVVDLAGALELPHLLESEGQREEDLVHPVVVRIVAHQLRVGADRLLAVALERLVRLALLLLELLDAPCVLLLPSLEDRLVQPAGLRVVERLELEVRLGQPQQVVGAARVAGAGAADETLEHLDLPLEQAERAALNPLAVASRGFVDLDARARHPALVLFLETLGLVEVRGDVGVGAHRTGARPLTRRRRTLRAVLDVLPRALRDADARLDVRDGVREGLFFGRRILRGLTPLRSYRER